LTGERVIRRLAAILAADVVGYSRLMGRDENGTLARLREHRKQRFEPVLARHGGRLVKLMGDGALAEFPSAVDALSAAISFQQAMAEANRDQSADTAIVFRIGLHLGDLIVDSDDLYGDGVNVAARLEVEAPPGGILVSRAVREAVDGRLKAKLHALGELSLKNIEKPIRAFRVEWEATDWKPTAAPAPKAVQDEPTAPAPTTPALALPDKPSIAVLPFQNMSGDPEQEYFTDGVTEDIITELSRFHSLFVIARNSSFSYKGKSPDIRQVGRELGVRYILEGSIRKSSNRIRVTGQLIDTLTGNHIWAERYNRVLEDIFAVQEEVTRAIVGAIAPQIEASEQLKATRPRPSNLTAYEIALRSRAHALEGYDKADRAIIDQSIQEAKEALALDANCIPALLALARAHGNTLLIQLAVDQQDAIRQATWAIARAIELDSTDAFGYALRGFIVMLSYQFDRYPAALGDARHAHEMNPNDPTVLRFLASLEAGVGEGEHALKHLHQALRLSPRQSRNHELYQLLSYASFVAKQYTEGIGWALRALNDVPSFIPAHGNLVACLVGGGKIDEAKAAFAAGQKLAPAFFKIRLDGESVASHPEVRKRHHVFFRVAAGLEDPSAAEALR
jgi:adenylate cyclase